MSFLGGSECATNSNPLARFNKQASADRSLEQSARQGAAGHGMAAGGRMRQPAVMKQGDRAQMEAFLQNQAVQRPASAFNFQPMARELGAIDRGGVMKQGNSGLVKPSVRQTAGKQARGWSSEFNSIQQSQAEQQTQAQQQAQQAQQAQPMMMGGGILGGGMLGGGMLGGMGSMMGGMSGYQNMVGGNMNRTSAETGQRGEENWEESFKQVEQEAVKQEGTSKTTTGEVPVTATAGKSALDETYDAMKKAEQSSSDQAERTWREDFAEYASGRANYGEYQFSKENRFAKQDGAYEIGCRLMEKGARLSEAALAFEAAVQQNPNHVDAWLRLGQVQTQNEKELEGIAALEKCLELSPQNLPALMTLAISYVNEGYDNAAYATLERWIETKYPDVVKQARREQVKRPGSDSDDRYTLNKRITSLFLRAAQLSPRGASMDADVQTGLGVLFYSLEEYDKTIDCFRAAIHCDPNDALCWNRLGASLANSNRPEQAIEAYTKALQLNPNFVRARYNLGVSFINMGMYKDAVDHLLTGLSMHEVEAPDANGGAHLVGDTMQSTSLMETLKRAFLSMNRHDLVDRVKPGMNIEQFRKQNGF